jgi:hypothetical protein
MCNINKDFYLIPDDGYILNHIAYHLKESDNLNVLKKLLKYFEWIRV